MLAPIQGQHAIALARAARSDASCSAAAPTGQTGMVDRSDRSRWGSLTRIQRTPAWDGPRRGRRILGCPTLGRPAIGRPQTPWRRRKNYMSRLKKLGFG